MNFEVAKPKLNINMQNSLGLINLIWSQPPRSNFVCLQLFFPLLLLCGLQRGMISRLVSGRDCIFPLLWSEKCGHFSKKPLSTKSWFATSSSLCLCWEGGELCWGRCVPAESPAPGSLVPTHHVWLEGEAHPPPPLRCQVQIACWRLWWQHGAPSRSFLRKQHQGNHLFLLFLIFFFNTLSSFTTDEALLPS